MVLLPDRAPQLRPQSRRVRVAFTQIPKGVPRHLRVAEERRRMAKLQQRRFSQDHAIDVPERHRETNGIIEL